ncbi:hypothetical protein JCM8097_008400 [Rhodosporidiobolus ruineniae]
MPSRSVSTSALSTPAAAAPSRSSPFIPPAQAPKAGIPSSPLSVAASTSHIPKPRIPKLTLDLSRLPCLIHYTTFSSRFLPFADPVLYGQSASAVEEKQPEWSWYLESYYRMYLPAFWVLAEREYEAGLEFVRRYGRWKAAVEGGEAGTVDACEVTRMSFAAEDVERATKRLFRNVYCLHHVRNLYLAHHRRLSPDKSDQQILEDTLQHEKRPYCTVAASSVWPLPSPLPDLPPPSHTPSVSKLTHLPDRPFFRRTSARYVLPADADVDLSASGCRLRLFRRTASPPTLPPLTTPEDLGSGLLRSLSKDLTSWTSSRREELQRRKSREGHIRLAEEEEAEAGKKDGKAQGREEGWYEGEGAWAAYWF